MAKKKWTLEGYDTFSNESYSLQGSYNSEKEARAAASLRLGRLEQSQPTASSGGQGFGGIQDRVYIVSPTGERTRA